MRRQAAFQFIRCAGEHVLSPIALGEPERRLSAQTFRNAIRGSPTIEIDGLREPVHHNFAERM